MKIALVVHDTLRKDAFDDAFEWLSGRRFESAYSTANWTVPAHASLFTGQYSSSLGVHSQSVYLDDTPTTLAEHLQDAGYTTRGMSANVNITGQFNFDRGFDVFDAAWRARPFQDNVVDWRNVRGTSSNHPLLSGLRECLTGDYDILESLRYGWGIKQGYDDDGGREILEWVKDQTFDTNEFIFLNLMEAHGPYRAPEEYRTVEPTTSAGLPETIRSRGDADARRARTAYNDCVRYLSDLYRDIMSVFEAADFDLVVTCADHGELFGEHGVWQHDYGVYPELVHVPLVLSGELLTEGEVTKPVSLLDVHATILDAAGVEANSAGQTLLDGQLHPQHEVMTEYMGIPLQKKYDALVEEFGVEITEKYDAPFFGIASDEGYIWETIDGVRPAGAERPAELGEHRETALASSEKEQSSEIPERLEGQLEDLGYL